MSDTWPDNVYRFLVDNIDSIEQLEILLLLKSDPTNEWSADAVSKSLYTTPVSAANRLNKLCGLGLIERTSSDQRMFRYRSSTQSDSLIDAVELAYRERRVAVVSLIYSKSTEQVRAFADAFKFRRDK